MRSEEFIIESWVDINGCTNYIDAIIIEECRISDSTLLESLQNDEIEYIKNVKESMPIPSIGKCYAPILIMLFPTKVTVMGDKKLMKFTGKNTDGALTILTFTDGSSVKTYPDSRLSAVSYAELFTFENSTQYDDFKMKMHLKFDNLTLPTINFN